MSTIIVRGATLAGLATATRLAKVGHQVTLETLAQPLGGHWAATEHHPDSLPQTISLRASWMDLLRKTGRAFDAELARNRLSLVPAPPTIHRFADGVELVLPDERGAQFHAVRAAFGQHRAERWALLLDQADAVWRAVRFAGLERPWPQKIDTATKQALWASRTLHELADQVGEPHLAQLVRDLGPLAGAAATDTQTPALLLSRAAMDRQFGRWQFIDDAGTAQPAGVLIELLAERLTTRKVRVRVEPESDLAARADAVVLATPRLPEGWLARRRAQPAWAPRVSHGVAATLSASAMSSHGIQQIVEHTDNGPIVRWERPLNGDQVAVLTHDHTQAQPDLNWGLAPSSWRSWANRPGLRPKTSPNTTTGVPTWSASASNSAGNEPWAELLSAALACYDLHEHLTGEDIRPTNKARRSS